MGIGWDVIANTLLLAQRELLLLLGVAFTLAAADELAVDALYIRLLIRRGGRDPMFVPPPALSGPAAVFVPAWREDRVIGTTIRQALDQWGGADFTLYVGCYRNDPATIAAAAAAAQGDARLRIVVHEADGPTTKPDCLNRLWRALLTDEQRLGRPVRMVLLQDAEDWVDPAALALCDAALDTADMVQLPVLALPQNRSRWVGSHYSDEFAEAHAKTLLVRDALGAAVPGAGVGCAVARPMLSRLARAGDEDGPFAPLALTEDYELGLRIAQAGGRTRFVRMRAPDGRLIATRAYFPTDLSAAIRQKTRWIHGIALQGWDRLGWSGTAASLWMQMRDRRGPLAAVLLAQAYALVLLTLAVWALERAGWLAAPPLSPLTLALIRVNLAFFIWRAGVRAVLTGREYGWRVGLLSAPRLLVGNAIAVASGARALSAYARTLRGAAVVWDKTEHTRHPGDSGSPAAA